MKKTVHGFWGFKIPFPMNLKFFLKLSIWKRKRQKKDTYREIYREKHYHLLVHSPNTCKGEHGLGQKLGAQWLRTGLPHGVLEIQSLESLLWLPRVCISRKQELGVRAEYPSQALQYGTLACSLSQTPTHPLTFQSVLVCFVEGNLWDDFHSEYLCFYIFIF